MTATAEKYARATRSSHLRMRDEPGDVDTLAAAGMARESLGVSLLRLQAQYDATSKPRANSSVTEHLLVLIQLSGLSALKDRLGLHAERQAVKRKVLATPQDLNTLVGRVLDVFLDPSCHPCSGRGYTGGYGAPALRCAVCRESGKRRIDWKEISHLADFGFWMLSDMNARMDEAEHQIRRALRQSL